MWSSRSQTHACFIYLSNASIWTLIYRARVVVRGKKREEKKVTQKNMSCGCWKMDEKKQNDRHEANKFAKRKDVNRRRRRRGRVKWTKLAGKKGQQKIWV